MFHIDSFIFPRQPMSKKRQILQCNISPSAPSIWLNMEEMTGRLWICESYQTTCSAWFWSTELRCLLGHYWTQFWHQHITAEIQLLSQHVDREDNQTWLLPNWIFCFMAWCAKNDDTILGYCQGIAMRLLWCFGWLLGKLLTFFFCLKTCKKLNKKLNICNDIF